MPDPRLAGAGTPPPRPSDRRWSGRRLLRAAGYAVGFSIPITALALVTRSESSPLVVLDQRIIASATDLTRAHPVLLDSLIVWQQLFQPVYVYLVATGVCVWVWRRHRLAGRSVWAFATMMLSWNLALDLKLLVQRARPVVEEAVAVAPGYSFPSGHAANTAAAATAVTILLLPTLARRGRAVTLVVAATLVVVTALDRVLLGVHYPTDVVAGVLLGVGIVLASYAGYRR